MLGVLPVLSTVAMASMRPLDVIVVGGGIAGLSAAQRLAQQGLSVRVLEAGQRPGGAERASPSPLPWISIF